MPAELHRDTVFPLGNIIALANVVERIKLHHQMMHAAAPTLSDGEAMMARVDVHEIQGHRRPHEISDPEAQQVPIEREGRFDVGHHQHGMAHALRPSTETRNIPPRTKRFIGDLTTVERLHAVVGRVPEGNHLRCAPLIRYDGVFPPHLDAGPFQPRGQRIERRCIRNLPAEKALSILQPTVNDEALLPVVHTEGTHRAAAIDRLKP